MEELFVLDDNSCSCVSLPNTLGETTTELLALFSEELPYNTVDTLDGQCIIWDEDFISKILFAMATNSLANMSGVEKQVWYQFVEFQDSMSHSADSSVEGAIGCTNIDENGKSFVVTTNGITTIECGQPSSSVQKEMQSRSLDSYLMNLLNCQEGNDCETNRDEIVDISPCII